jgi:hypothetical protein
MHCPEIWILKRVLPQVNRLAFARQVVKLAVLDRLAQPFLS